MREYERSSDDQFFVKGVIACKHIDLQKINKLSGFERVLVSSESGTTRDSIEVPVKEREITLIDTAGVRKKSVSNDKVEQFSISQ